MLRITHLFMLLGLVAVLAAPPSSSRADPIVAGSPAATVVYPLPYRTAAARASQALELVMVNLINRERVATGLAPLTPHATIRSVARLHGLEMFAFGFLSHRSRDGRSPTQRVLSRGVRTSMVGENIAYAADVRRAHEALMASETHRQNILLREYKLVGIGVVDGGPYGVVVVEDFSD